MAITLLQTQERQVKYVLPRAHGFEERDPRAFPLPPGTSVALVAVVVDELREQGHEASFHVEHERLVDWSRTHRMSQHSEELYGSGDTVLHFVSGGCAIRVTCGERTLDLLPMHLRAGRAGLKFWILGRP